MAISSNSTERPRYRVPELKGLSPADRDSVLKGIDLAIKLGREDLIEDHLREWGVQPKKRNELLRGLGLAGRAIVGGPLKTAAFASGLPFEAVRQGVGAMGGPDLPIGLGPAMQGSENILNMLGFPQPETTGERLVGAGGEAMFGGGALPFAAKAMGASGPIINALTAQPGLVGTSAALSGAASQGAAELGGGPWAQFGAGLVGGMTPAVPGALAGRLQGALAGNPAQRLQGAQNLQTFLGAGVEPSAGQVAAGGAARRLQGGLRQTVGGGGRLFSHYERLTQGLKQTTEELVGRLGGGRSREVAGQTIQRGIEQGFIPKFRGKTAELYGEVAAQIPPDTPVGLQNTIDRLANLTSVDPRMPATTGQFVNPKIQSIVESIVQDRLAGGQPTFGTLQTLRSRVGAMLDGSELVSDIPRGELKQLYGGIVKDMEAAVAGNPRAERALRNANRYVRKGHEVIDDVLDPLVNQRTPEKVFGALMQGGKEGGTIVRSTMSKLNDQQRRVVSATVLERMGKAAPGAQNAEGDIWSPNTFMSSWAKLDKGSQKILFGHYGKEFSDDMDRLVRATALTREASLAMGNTSGTAQNNAYWEVLSRLSTGPVTGTAVGLAAGPAAGALAGTLTTGIALAPVATSNLIARAFTSPTFVRWMVRQSTLPAGVVGGQVDGLRRMAERSADAEDRETAMMFADYLSEEFPPPPPRVSADATLTVLPR